MAEVMELVAIADFGPGLTSDLIDGRLVKLTEFTLQPWIRSS